MPRFKLAFTLIETLVCLAIIMILSATATFCYTGAIDHADLKFTLPQLARMLTGYQEQANKDQAVVVVECPKGQGVINVTTKKNGDAKTRAIDLRTTVSLLQRRHVFKDYKWPDGTEAPRTFTFIPGAAPQGGTVWFGTGFSEGKLMIVGGRVDWEL